MRTRRSVGMTFDPLCDPTLLLDQAVWQQTQDLLSQLGERLCCGSATLALSEALRLPDYTGASDEFSVMAEKIMDYSPDTRQLLSTQFLETSVRSSRSGSRGFPPASPAPRLPCWTAPSERWPSSWTGCLC